jgi:predicted DCC family thiol-disulfide oxidoreductase YuxK
MAETNETGEDHILLFDGVCNLCNAYVRFFIKRDPRKRLRFAPLQSETGQSILMEHGLPTDHLSSIVFVESGLVYFNSSTVLRACGYLRFPWPVAKVFLLFPRPLRDLVYNWIARNRYHWFGKRKECFLPAPEDANRFL